MFIYFSENQVKNHLSIYVFIVDKLIKDGEVILNMVFRRIDEHQAQFLSSNKIYDMLIEDDDIFEKIFRVFDFSFIYDEFCNVCAEVP